MKKLIVLSSLLLALVSSSFASGTIAFAGENHFKKTYAAATNVTYKQVNEFTEVNFTLNGEKLQAFYDEEGNLVATSKHILIAQLPQAAQDCLKSDKYKDFDVTEVIQYEQADNATHSYYINLENDKQKVILNVTAKGSISVFKKSRK